MKDCLQANTMSTIPPSVIQEKDQKFWSMRERLFTVTWEENGGFSFFRDQQEVVFALLAGSLVVLTSVLYMSSSKNVHN